MQIIQMPKTDIIQFDVKLCTCPSHIKFSISDFISHTPDDVHLRSPLGVPDKITLSQ